MYHLDVNWGESPPFATVKPAPSVEYVGLPCGVNESDCPDVKSILTDLPRAVSGGQLPGRVLIVCRLYYVLSSIFTYLTLMDYIVNTFVLIRMAREERRDKLSQTSLWLAVLEREALGMCGGYQLLELTTPEQVA